MSETYEIYTPNGLALDVEKDTNKILFKENVKPTGNYTEEYSKALFEAHNIKQNSPYKDYQPQYLDPEFHTGEKSTLLEFKDWQSIYLKDPKYNFAFHDMKHIKEANDKYILMEEVEDDPCIYQNALIYDYILSADNPNSQIIKYLVNRGAKFEVHDEGYSGRTPMHFWARRNNYELLELAIKGGANVDMQTFSKLRKYSKTLLFEAVSEAETYRVTQLLIELGANVNFATPRTPLDNAKGSRNKKLLKDAGAMTSNEIRKKFNLPAYDDSHCEIDGKTDFDLLGKYRDECSKLLNDAIKKAKESE